MRLHTGLTTELEEGTVSQVISLTGGKCLTGYTHRPALVAASNPGDGGGWGGGVVNLPRGTNIFHQSHLGFIYLLKNKYHFQEMLLEDRNSRNISTH